jgi:predicted molibdopterin-dependent oxidoreductase YjgC
MSHGERDFLMGSSSRHDVLMAPDDAASIGVREGEAIRLRSEVGEWVGVARLAPMKRRHLQAYWPETNVLIPRRFDPVSGEPDYNTMVSAEAVGPPGATTPLPVEETAKPVRASEPQPVMARARTRQGR